MVITFVMIAMTRAMFATLVMMAAFSLAARMLGTLVVRAAMLAALVVMAALSLTAMGQGSP